jgi:hypothetical protein
MDCTDDDENLASRWANISNAFGCIATKAPSSARVDKDALWPECQQSLKIGLAHRQWQSAQIVAPINKALAEFLPVLHERLLRRDTFATGLCACEVPRVPDLAFVAEIDVNERHSLRCPENCLRLSR